MRLRQRAGSQQQTADRGGVDACCFSFGTACMQPSTFCCFLPLLLPLLPFFSMFLSCFSASI